MSDEYVDETNEERAFREHVDCDRIRRFRDWCESDEANDLYSPQFTRKLMDLCGDVRDGEAARCTAARLTPAEREVLRGLVATIERADHDADEEIAAAARNALPLIARLVETRDADDHLGDASADDLIGGNS